MSGFSFPGVVEHHYRFCAWLLPKVSKFERDQRYLLGSRLQNTSLDILEHLISASVCPVENKAVWVARASARLEHLRFLFRLSYSIKMVNARSYEYGAKSLTEMGRMLGGWQRTIQKVVGDS